jgi:NADH dehydrogenase FAD-containing subunit
VINISDHQKNDSHIRFLKVSGAGFIGVEWATELQHFFPKLKITIIDFLPNCLGPLPVSAQK